ncbi:MAG: type II secretion system F family protein [Firmicutes bacterium]|nr:type II secretion system F family protein [Bacillota bacterium]
MAWISAASISVALALLWLWYGQVESGWLVKWQLENGKIFQGSNSELTALVVKEIVTSLGEIIWRRLAPTKAGIASSERLNAAGNPRQMTPEELWGWRMVLAIGGGLVIGIAGGELLLGCIGGYLCSRLPLVWLSLALGRREAAIRRSLPSVLDLLVICTGAGLTFDAAINIIVEKSPPDPLIDEFNQVLHHMRMGDSRQAALRRMADRCPQPDVRSVAATLIQADQLGTSISSTLLLLAEQIRITQAHRAEARANQAPVKMLFPLLFFIFPSLLLILFGPVFLGGSF